MRLYARREEGITPAKWDLFLAMEADVEALPDLDPPEAVSCHVLCHALSVRHGVPAVDGWYAGRMNWHSWIDLGDGIVADMYPVAGGRPQIVDTNGMLNPVSRLYQEVPDALERIGVRPDVLASVLLQHLGQGDPTWAS
jgi:hypothetical protein